MAEKIRPLHLPPTSTPSQQPLLVPTSSSDGGAQHGLSVPKPQPQQVPGHHPQPQGSGPSDIALHARPVSSSGSGTALIPFPFVGVVMFHRLFINHPLMTSRDGRQVCGQGQRIVGGLAHEAARGAARPEQPPLRCWVHPVVWWGKEG